MLFELSSLYLSKTISVKVLFEAAHNKTYNKTCATSEDSDQSDSLRKHAYSNMLKIFPPKNENFQIKISDIFHISAQNIDCGYSLEPPRRGGSNEYPQSMF